MPHPMDSNFFIRLLVDPLGLRYGMIRSILYGYALPAGT